MKFKMNLIAIAIGSLSAGAAFAQAGTVQRDVNQQQRIEQGLKSGNLSTGEAARLEKGEARIDRMQANAMKDGTLSAAEKARIQNAQNRESRAIYNQKHDAQTGNPN